MGRLKKKTFLSVHVAGELLQTVMLSGWSNQMHVTLLGTRVPCFGLVFVSCILYSEIRIGKKSVKRRDLGCTKQNPIEKVRSEMIDSMSDKSYRVVRCVLQKPCHIEVIYKPLKTA